MTMETLKDIGSFAMWSAILFVTISAAIIVPSFFFRMIGGLFQ